MPRPDITAIVNLHTEGKAAVASLRSLMAAKVCAEAQGISVEILAVLDSASDETVSVIMQCGLPDMTSIEVSIRDLGKSRNVGAEVANGEWIAFLDGDDLWSENWLQAAYEFAQKNKPKTIFHPQASVYFGDYRQIYMHMEMDDTDYDVLNLSMSNCWTALAFAKRETYLAVRYPQIKPEHQIGYEDWGWHLETISRGYRHKCVPGTLHAIRKRGGGLTSQADDMQAMPPSTWLFRNLLLSRNL
jgi:glycosyltransferase involved in cell wall biosynthesis